MAVYLSRTGIDPMVISWLGTAVAVGYAAYVTYSSGRNKNDRKQTLVNPDIKKDQPKVVDTFDMEDMGNKTVFCRCWRSKKFPYCDGSHGRMNNECGDNVGPLIVQRRDVQGGDK